MRKVALFKKLLLLLFLAVLLAWLPGPAYAQQPDQPAEISVDWQELKTQDFIIVYGNSVTSNGQPVDCPACGPAVAEHYATFVDQVYTDLKTVFQTDLNLPVNLHLFPTDESYYQVNPLAETARGVIAHTVEARSEINVALPRTTGMSVDAETNNLRHEMTHLFVSFLSNDKVNTAFHEGTAQYLEQPNDQSNRKPELLHQASEQKRLFSWAQMDDPEQFYKDPEVAYPQALSMVSFLIDRYGLPSYIEFLKAFADQPGYRSALEAVYNKPADELEGEWQAYLPDYFNGRWQVNAVYAYDLSRVTDLVNQGAFTDAVTQLTQIIALLETTNQAGTLAQAKALLTQAQQGQAAGALADATRQALENGDYAGVIEQGNAAIAAYQQTGYTGRIAEIQTYMHRASVGQNALKRLAGGEDLLNSWRFFEAEPEIYEATILLQSLGNQQAAQHGIDLLHESAGRKRMLGYALVAVVLALLLFNGLRRLYNRLSNHPLEVELS